MTFSLKTNKAARLLTMLIVCLVPSALLSTSAGAHSGEEHGDLPANAADRAKAMRAVLGGDAEPTPKGLLRIETEETETLTTHGPDFRAYNGSQPGFRQGDPERTPVCASDNYQRVVYAYPVGALPADATSEIAEVRSIMRRMNYVLNADSLGSGGPSADYKVRCDGSGRIQVDTVAVAKLDAGAVIDTVAGLLGSVDKRADYTIFLDAPNAGWCGIGTYVADETPGAGNANNQGGGYALIERGCWNTTAPMHENGHNQGAVQYFAPSSTGVGAHCAEDFDVMCYSPDGGDLRQGGTTERCTDRIHFDCRYDDYFDSAPEPGEYLASNWNIGSPENRFIRFSQPQGPQPEPATGVPGIDEADTTAPELVILQRPSRKLKTRSAKRKVRFKFNAYEQNASYRCRIDRRRWRGCRSPYELRLRKGRHVFRARAIDEAGNRSKIQRVKFRIVRKRRR